MYTWLLYKYKYLWDVGSKGRNSSLQEGVSYTYTLRLDKSKISILYKKKVRLKKKVLANVGNDVRKI